MDESNKRWTDSSGSVEAMLQRAKKLTDANTLPVAPEKSGGDCNYWLLNITEPKRLAPYECEAEDIIEALGMTFAEGCAFKAIWRSCIARTLGKYKEGMDKHGVYDAEKVKYYGQRMLAQRKKDAKRDQLLDDKDISTC